MSLVAGRQVDGLDWCGHRGLHTANKCGVLKCGVLNRLPVAAPQNCTLSRQWLHQHCQVCIDAHGLGSGRHVTQSQNPPKL